MDGSRFSAARHPPGALSPEVAIASTRLPGVLHADPADRIIAATARQLDAVLVTEDQRLLDYGAAGYLKTRRAAV